MIVMIKQEHLIDCLEVLHMGYESIAVQSGLTKENCPHRGRADLPLQILRSECDDGAQLYGYMEGNKLTGVLSVKSEGNHLKINDLVVLPAFQRQGIGAALLDFAKDAARQVGYTGVELGMIDDNRSLRAWYEKHGFVNTGYHHYPGAPITVGTMVWTVNQESPV